MIFRYIESTPVKVLPGVLRRTLITTDKLMVCEFKLNKAAEVPIHSHPHEQVGYVVKGNVRMTINNIEYELTTGDSYAAPPNVSHGASIIDDSIIIDTFSPPREDYK
jgi:quercetin dioxygenase-like cupin family protein